MNRRQQDELIQSAFDQTISEDDFQRLQKLLRENADLRALYHDYCRLDHALTEEFEPRSFVPARLRAHQPAEAPQRRSMIQAVLSAAAIVVALLVAAYFIALKPPQPSTAVLFGPESHGQIVHEQAGGSRTELLPGSRLTLQHGSVRLTLPSGVRAIIEGPAVLESLGKNEVSLDEGRAWFQVPPGAEGFTCQTPTLHIVDLGTEFGVIATPGLPEELHVLKGKVRVAPANQLQATRDLHAGEGISCHPDGWQTLPATRPFVTALPTHAAIFSDDFSEADGTPLAGKSPDLGAGPWSVVQGQPVINDRILDTSGTAKMAFAPLDCQLNDLDHILLLTIGTQDPDTRFFHTDGWAGVSLFTGEEERIFVGDPGGTSNGWAIHPFGGEAVTASPPLEGKQIVTLRYDFRNGLAELFAGPDTNGQPLASEWIAPGLNFDRLRVNNDMGGDIALDSLRVARLQSPTPQP